MNKILFWPTFAFSCLIAVISSAGTIFFLNYQIGGKSICLLDGARMSHMQCVREWVGALSGWVAAAAAAVTIIFLAKQILLQRTANLQMERREIGESILMLQQRISFIRDLQRLIPGHLQYVRNTEGIDDRAVRDFIYCYRNIEAYIRDQLNLLPLYTTEEEEEKHQTASIMIRDFFFDCSIANRHAPEILFLCEKGKTVGNLKKFEEINIDQYLPTIDNGGNSKRVRFDIELAKEFEALANKQIQRLKHRRREMLK